VGSGLAGKRDQRENEMSPTTGAQLVAMAFSTLAAEEQEDAFERINDIRLGRLAGDESATAQLLLDLIRVRELMGHVPTVDEYRQAYRELKDSDAGQIAEVNRLLRHFGSWRRAIEALGLSEVTTVRRIDARFRSRRLGKVWKYTEETLRDTLAQAVEHYGRPMTVAEFDWWRERQFQLAKAEGKDGLHLASATPYRKRWGGWEGALRHFGYDPELSGTRA
jgi:Homing endonuclease associated repeat